MPTVDPNPGNPPPGFRYVKTYDAQNDTYSWVLRPIPGYVAPDVPPSTPPPGAGPGQYIKVNGTWQWSSSVNSQYVTGSAEDPIVKTQRDRAQREYNAAYYAWVTGGTRTLDPASGQYYMVQGPAPDPAKFSVGSWRPTGTGYGAGYGGQGGGTTTAPATTTPPTTTTPPAATPSRFTPTLPARTQNTARGPAYSGMPTSLMPASMRGGRTKVGGFKRGKNKQAI